MDNLINHKSGYHGEDSMRNKAERVLGGEFRKVDMNFPRSGSMPGNERIRLYKKGGHVKNYEEGGHAKRPIEVSTKEHDSEMNSRIREDAPHRSHYKKGGSAKAKVTSPMRQAIKGRSKNKDMQFPHVPTPPLNEESIRGAARMKKGGKPPSHLAPHGHVHPQNMSHGGKMHHEHESETHSHGGHHEHHHHHYKKGGHATRSKFHKEELGALHHAEHLIGEEGKKLGHKHKKHAGGHAHHYATGGHATNYPHGKVDGEMMDHGVGRFSKSEMHEEFPKRLQKAGAVSKYATGGHVKHINYEADFVGEGKKPKRSYESEMMGEKCIKHVDKAMGDTHKKGYYKKGGHVEPNHGQVFGNHAKTKDANHGQMFKKKGGPVKMAMGGVGKIRHKQATKDGMPI